MGMVDGGPAVRGGRLARLLAVLAVTCVGAAACGHPGGRAQDPSSEAPPLSVPSPASSTGASDTPQRPTPWPGPLPWPIIIADRGNNRILEVTPDKHIVWSFPGPGSMPPGETFLGGDDAFFANGGAEIITNQEHNSAITIIDYATRKAVWEYGHPGVAGRQAGYLNYPDDAYVLPNGNVAVADIRNCRELIIAPDKHIVQSWGNPDVCKDDPPRYFSSPNGDTPLPGGDLLITEINGGAGNGRAVRMTQSGQVLWNVRIPEVLYASDAQMLPPGDPLAGDLIVADYSKPGKVIIFNPQTGRVDWRYDVRSGPGALDHPSLATYLPNGNIIVTDDYQHRVVVIDRQTKQIVWQYGQTGVAGTAPGLLDTPDGLDLDTYHVFPHDAAGHYTGRAEAAAG
jgi:hypothetical protein